MSRGNYWWREEYEEGVLIQQQKNKGPIIMDKSILKTTTKFAKKLLESQSDNLIQYLKKNYRIKYKLYNP